MPKGQRRWTLAEDSILREGVSLQEAHPGRTINWNEIAKKIPDRSNKDCRKRYYNEVAGGLKKGSWTKEEDTRLKRCVDECGLAWAAIALKIENRSADQCSKRWHHSLNPGLERSPWTDAENQCLLTALAVHGNSWKDIQMTHFPSRSANNVKNQYTVISRKYIAVPADAPPCCPDGTVTAPVSDITSSSEISDFLDLDANGHVNSSGLLHFNDTLMYHFADLDEMNSSYPDMGQDDRRSSYAFTHDLGALYSPELNMSDLDTSDFHTSSVTTESGFGTGRSDFMGNEYFPSMDWDVNSSSRHTSASDTQSLAWMMDESSNQMLSKTCDPAPTDVSWFTFTIDDAEAETVMDVMEVLVQSRAKINFQTTASKRKCQILPAIH